MVLGHKIKVLSFKFERPWLLKLDYIFPTTKTTSKKAFSFLEHPDAHGNSLIGIY